LSAVTLRSRALPLVEIRLVVPGGRAAEGDRTGIAGVTAALLLEGGTTSMTGREVRARLDALGAKFEIDSRLDATILRVKATPRVLADVLALVAAVVQKPSFDAAAFADIKKRELERVSSAASSDAAWGARMALFQSLFTLPTGHHPHASFDALPSEIEKIQLADCRSFHRRVFVPKNTRLVVAGDVAADDVRAAVEKAFAAYRAGEPYVEGPAEVMPPESLKITVVDQAKAAESEILAGVLGPPPSDARYAAFTIAGQTLGGPEGRLAADLRDGRKIATEIGASVMPLGGGPSVLVVRVRASVENTAAVVEAVIGQLEKVGTSEPTTSELPAAQRSASNALAMGLGSLAAITDGLAGLEILGLPGDHFAMHARELRSVTADAVRAVGAEYLRPGHFVIAIAADAGAVNDALRRFGEVRVVDAKKGFERVSTLGARPEGGP
jgi:predicted Zn-dependent peptidase